MEMLFRDATITDDEELEGIDKLQFTCFDLDIEAAFQNSIWKMMGILSRYDIELYDKVHEKEIFYFYDKNMDKKFILEELDNIIKNGDTANIINEEDIMMKQSIESLELNRALGIENGFEAYADETVFWDTLNHFVVIVGCDQLKKFACLLDEEKNKRYLSQYETCSPSHSINKELFSVPSIQKMLVLSEKNK